MANSDRISFLPVEIKASILSHLELRDAIRTSAVARSWRRLWTLRPCLRLDYCEDRLGDASDDLTTSSRWMERVHHLVSSLHGPLLDFELSHSAPDSTEQASLFQSLLDLLLRKGGLEMLDLYIHYPHVVIHLPSFPFLRVLQLFGCHVILPVGFPGFNRLTTLNLRYVEISNDDLNLLIHTSSNLTTLVRLDCINSKDPLSVNLNFPLMRYLYFNINDSVDEVSVIYAPCLEKAHFTLRCIDYTSEKLAQVTLRLVTSVARVSSLNLSQGVLENLSIAAMPLNFIFPRLKCLNLYLNIDNMGQEDLSCFSLAAKEHAFS